MKGLFSRIFPLLISLILLSIPALTTSSCSRKSGCPAEDAHTKTDKSGMPKGKAKSGLLPPKAYKKKKS